MPQFHAFALSALLIVAGSVTYVLGENLESGATPTTEHVQVLSAQVPAPEVELPLGAGPMTASITPDAEQDLLVKVIARVAATTTTTTTTVHKRAGAPRPRSTTTTAPASSPPPTTSTAGFRADYEKDFYNKINSFRTSNGLSALTRDGSLNSRARDWAKYLASIGELKHSNLGSLIPPWDAAAENLGMGGSVDAIWELLASSGGHIDTMLDNYTHVGVGVYQDADGVLWTVHVFARS